MKNGLATSAPTHTAPQRKHHLASTLSEDEVAQYIVLTCRMFLYNVGTVFYTCTQAIYPVPVEVALVVWVWRCGSTKHAEIIKVIHLPFKVILTANGIADNWKSSCFPEYSKIINWSFTRNKMLYTRKEIQDVLKTNAAQSRRLRWIAFFCFISGVKRNSWMIHIHCWMS